MLRLEFFIGLTFLLAVVLVIVQFTLYHRLTGVLRDEHHATWVELGSPTLLSQNSIQSALRMQKFLGREEFGQLGDPRVARLGRAARTVTVAGYAVFGVLLILVLVLIVKGSQAPRP